MGRSSAGIPLKLLTLIIAAFACSTSFAQQPTARELYEQGVSLLHENRPGEALLKLEESVEIDDTDPRPYALIGTIHFTLENFGRSVDAFRKAVELRPNDPKVWAGLCRALAADGKVLEGIEECRRAIAIDPDSQRANTDLIIVLRLQSSPSSDLRDLIERALSRFPDNIEILVAAAGYFERRDTSRSVGLYERLAEIQPETPVWHMKLAELYIDLERDKDAIDAANRVLALDPKNALANFFLGRVYFDLGQNTDAAEAFQRALETAPGNESYLFFLAKTEQRRRAYEEAAAAYSKLVALKPDSFEYNAELGGVLSLSSKPLEAIPYFRKALSIEPDDQRTKARLGLALTQIGQFQESIQILESANRQDPSDEIVKMFLGVARIRQRNIAQLDDIKAKAAADPDDWKIRGALFQILGYARRMEEAEVYAEEFRKLDPQDSESYTQMGVVYFSNGDLKRAEASHRKALEIREDAGAYLGLAHLYARTDQPDKAVEAYENVIRVKPDVPNIMISYGNYLLDIGRKREALDIFKRSLALQPLNTVALLNAGCLSARLGDTDSANGYLVTLRSLGSPDAKILERCIRVWTPAEDR
ncbi:MAG TPA: tetratricopeptide repeat protein [Aridibacter sp.]|nr:tetratricopeptide repeat protein [Aridibacter sp.]